MAALATTPMSWAAAEAQEKAEETRDCETCPTLVKTPLGYFGKFPVTRGEYRAFAEATKLEADGCVLRGEKKRSMVKDANWTKPGYEQGDDHPAVCVSWVEATAYADWLSEKTGKKYRLPTFEEISQAAAAGTATDYWWGSSFQDICKHANVADAQFKRAFPVDDRKLVACDDGYAYTSPVTAFAPNPWGLYDMAGNVWNWTNSCLKGDCANAVFRGAGWDVPFAHLFKSDYSFGDRIVLRNDVIGFRVFREE
jgi:formylglycine-generating enzyme required for sulfatase activity